VSVTAVSRYVTAYNRLRVLTGKQVGRLWDLYGGLDDPSLEQFVTTAVPLVHGAEATTVRLTAAYLTETRRPHGIEPARVDPTDIIGVNLRGVDPVDVYRRPVVTARTAISDGHPLEQAMRMARDRAVSTAETDIALAQRATQNAALAPGVVGYRRVLTGNSCVLCAAASTQRYTRGDLMPIHNHCDCGVSEIYGAEDPGQVINQKLLADLKQRSTENSPYWRDRHAAVDEDGQVVLRAEVRAHGELGPVLTRPGDKFTTESQALG
jgi:hypothetical protein